MPIAIQGLFETHLMVSNLGRAVAFYRDVLGLTLARTFPDRDVAFFWIGPPGSAMLGLWGGGSGPQKMTLHTAFRVTVEDVLAAPGVLKAAGVEPLDFDGVPCETPVVLAWMPAVSLYFRDPDGNMLEYIAMLPQPPRPELGVVSWSEWQGQS